VQNGDDFYLAAEKLAVVGEAMGDVELSAKPLQRFGNDIAGGVKFHALHVLQGLGMGDADACHTHDAPS
jgi:hypothetical protein